MSDFKEHILVIRFSSMGDVAMVVPVLRALSNQHKSVKITVLTNKIYTPFFRNFENVSVFGVELKGRHKGFLGLFRLFKELKPLNFSKVADLHNVLRSNILKLFFYGKNFKQIDKGRAKKRKLISGKEFIQLKTTHQRYADVFERLGYQINLSNPKFEPKIELSQSLKLLVNYPLADKKVIGIAPFAAHQGKMYSLKQMEIVIATLSKSSNVILFGGGKKETVILSNLAKKYQNTISVAGKITLSNELDIISNLDIMISMDSANAHIAAMFGIKVITIWGVTHPFAGFYPFNQPKYYALLADKKLYPKIPTSVYGNKYPKGYENAASQTISPEQVVAKVEEILS